MNYTFTEAFKDHVLASDAVTALLDRRFTPNVAPESVLADDPEVYAVYSLVSEVPARHLHGPSSYAEARIQVDIYARQYIVGREVAEAIREHCDGFSGVVSGTNGDMHLRGIRLDDQQDQYHFGDSSEKGWHQISLDFMVWHTTTVPLTVGG